MSDLVQLQEQLLEAACHVVAPGGLLAYVTCTPTIDETTGVLATVMAGRSDFRPDAVAPIIDSVSNGSVSLDGTQPYVQLWPHINNTDAMFISIFERTAN
jgi:16S rRNA (cytosine967-C5)-methyltransferase